MTALPPTLVRANVESELDQARAWATRHNWTLAWEPEPMRLRAATYHTPVGRLVELTAEVNGYRALPPAWDFMSPAGAARGPRFFPSAGPGSIFHPNALICAPWNRLAYAEHGGPHDNWSGPEAWLQVQEGTIAHTIPDMLAVIDAHLRVSPGLMG